MLLLFLMLDTETLWPYNGSPKRKEATDVNPPVLVGLSLNQLCRFF